MTNGLVFSSLGERDVTPCAELHARAFPTFFLSELGVRFLREFYAGFLDDPSSVTVVARDNDQVIGVVVGTTHPQGFFTRLLRRRWYAFAFASVPLLIRRPKVVARLVRAVFYRGQVGAAQHGALLSSICVAPERRGLALGQRLLEDWLGELSRRGGRAAYLTTDRDDNARVNRFYEQSGWVRAHSYATREGRWMNCYVWHSDGVGPSSRRTSSRDGRP